MPAESLRTKLHSTDHESCRLFSTLSSTILKQCICPFYVSKLIYLLSMGAVNHSGLEFTAILLALALLFHQEVINQWPWLVTQSLDQSEFGVTALALSFALKPWYVLKLCLVMAISYACRKRFCFPINQTRRCTLSRRRWTGVDILENIYLVCGWLFRQTQLSFQPQELSDHKAYNKYI